MIDVVLGLRDKLVEHGVHSLTSVGVATRIAMVRRIHHAIMRVASIIGTVEEVGIKWVPQWRAWSVPGRFDEG